MSEEPIEIPSDNHFERKRSKGLSSKSQVSLSEEDFSQENEEILEDCTEECSNDNDNDNDSEYSNNMMYFQNLDNLMSSYFSNEQVNIVVALQNLDKCLRDCTNVIKESIDQNSKCTLRVAKLIEGYTSSKK